MSKISGSLKKRVQRFGNKVFFDMSVPLESSINNIYCLHLQVYEWLMFTLHHLNISELDMGVLTLIFGESSFRKKKILGVLAQLAQAFGQRRSVGNSIDNDAEQITLRRIILGLVSG